jgi:hypothetical protein
MMVLKRIHYLPRAQVCQLEITAQNGQGRLAKLSSIGFWKLRITVSIPYPFTHMSGLRREAYPAAFRNGTNRISVSSECAAAPERRRTSSTRRGLPWIWTSESVSDNHAAFAAVRSQ